MEKQIRFEEISGISLQDHATGGECFNCILTVEQYYKLMSDIYEDSNDFQRSIFDIKRNRVYTKLVKDYLKGVVVPTISLYFEDSKNISKVMNINSLNVKILDGLQRTNCLIYAYKIITGLVQDDEIKNKIAKILSADEFKKSFIRIEIWINLSVNGILYKMVSLNAGQTPMSINHQFDILELPLLRELSQKGIKVLRQNEKTIEGSYEFYLASIVESSIAYNLELIFPRKQDAAISFLDQLDIYKNLHESLIMKSEIFMNDLEWVIKDFHKKQIAKYLGGFLFSICWNTIHSRSLFYSIYGIIRKV